MRRGIFEITSSVKCSNQSLDTTSTDDKQGKIQTKSKEKKIKKVIEYLELYLYYYYQSTSTIFTNYIKGKHKKTKTTNKKAFPNSWHHFNVLPNFGHS